MGRRRRKDDPEYQEFCEFCESVGIWNVSITAYSERSGKPTSTIHDWRNQYMRDWKFNKKEFAKQINHQGLVALKRLAMLTQGKDKGISLKASKALMEASDKYTDILVKLGVIEAEIEEPSLQINASDKDLYKMLNKTQKKKLARIAEDA